MRACVGNIRHLMHGFNLISLTKIVLVHYFLLFNIKFTSFPFEH